MIKNVKQTLTATLAGVAVLAAVLLPVTAGLFWSAPPALADHLTHGDCMAMDDSGIRQECLDHVNDSGTAASKKCQDVDLGVGVDCEELDPNENVIYTYLRAIIRFLSLGVGLVTVGMIVISGVRYITSNGNPQAIQDAKSKLLNAVFGLILFIFAVAIINFLIPGGLL